MTMAGWEIVAHVMPTDDAVKHTTQPDCICGPDAECLEEGRVFYHHPLDSREAPARRQVRELTGGLAR
jgi:hypothetical protein